MVHPALSKLERSCYDTGMAETALEMARRHVTEGRARIVRQEAIVASLTGLRSAWLLPNAQELLEHMRTLQRKAEERVVALEPKAE